MSTLDIIALILIAIHSIYRVNHPKKGTESRSAVANFFVTFILDFLIYLVISFIISFILGAMAPLAIINFFRRG